MTDENTKVKKGNKVSIAYTGSFDDGKVFDTNVNPSDGTCLQPLQFIVGAGMVIPGFDKAVEEMSVGQAKKIKILAKDAYGERNEDLVKTLPKPENFPAQAKEGMLIGVGPSENMQMPALIVKLTDIEVTLDLNHPLAGKNLNFDIKVLDIQEANINELENLECNCESDEHECECEEGECEESDCECDCEDHENNKKNPNHECKCKDKNYKSCRDKKNNKTQKTSKISKKSGIKEKGRKVN